MSVGIFQNGKYNKVAGNAKDSTAANTTYNNGTSGLQANNVQSAIDELNSNLANKIIIKDIALSVDVTENTVIQTYIPYDGIDKSKVISTTITWNNSLNDCPILCIYYGLPIEHVDHKWAVNQTVRFYIRISYYN